MPFFSVIIPTYNRAGDLKRSLESVLQQSVTDFEVVVVDDGSTDDTSRIVQSFTDTRIKYIYQENSERSAARNKGIQNASGIYICFLDSDDTYLPQHLATHKAMIDEHGQPIAMLKTKVKGTNTPNTDVVLPSVNSKSDAITYLWQKGCQLNSVCVHRDIVNSILFPEEFFWFEDNHWALRVVSDFPLLLINEYTCTYTAQDTFVLLYKDYKKYENNCVACMRDLELVRGSTIKGVLGNACFDIKIAEFYLGFIVAGAVHNKQIGLAKEYLQKAKKTTTDAKLFLKYAYYRFLILKATLL